MYTNVKSLHVNTFLRCSLHSFIRPEHRIVQRLIAFYDEALSSSSANGANANKVLIVSGGGWKDE